MIGNKPKTKIKIGTFLRYVGLARGRENDSKRQVSNARRRKGDLNSSHLETNLLLSRDHTHAVRETRSRVFKVGIKPV